MTATMTPEQAADHAGPLDALLIGAGAGPDGESDLVLAAGPEHPDPETVMARVRALA
jgi:hypothetical protein